SAALRCVCLAHASAVLPAKRRWTIRAALGAAARGQRLPAHCPGDRRLPDRATDNQRRSFAWPADTRVRRGNRARSGARAELETGETGRAADRRRATRSPRIVLFDQLGPLRPAGTAIQPARADA